MNSSEAAPVIPTPPMIGHGLYTLYPPVTDVPASLAQSLNPFIIRLVDIYFSTSLISVLTPNTIRMLSTLVNPIA